MDDESEAVMVVCKIEIWPHGDQSKARPLGQVVIINDGEGTPERGNYDVALSHGGIFYGRKGAWKTGRVLQHLRKLSPYHLLLSALKACLERD